MAFSAQQALGHVMSLNKRITAQHPNFTDQQIPPVYVYSVYPLPLSMRQVNLGGLGPYTIPLCEEGKAHSEPLALRFKAEDYDLADGAGHMAWNPAMPEDVAKDVVGIGSSTPNLDVFTTNREWWGVFYSHHNPPTKEEIAAANNKLTEMMKLLVRDGDRLALQGPKGLEQIGEMHRKAVQYTRQTRDWAKLPEKLIDCPGCGSPIKPSTVRCKECGAILDMEKAKSLGMLTPEQLSQMETKRK